jgi:site-specific recombinase XerD
MVPEIRRFGKWLRRKNPQATTQVHYVSDLKLFFAWARKPTPAITLRDVDAYIEHAQGQGHAVATVNRRLAALRSFYHFLAIESDDAPANPVLPKRHFIRQGRRLPRDVEDADVEKLFAAIASPRDRAMFLLMVRCGLRVGEVRYLSLGDLYLQPTPGSLPRLWLRGKNGTERIAYLSAQALEAVLAWLAVRPAAKDQALFLNRFGHRLTVTGIQDRLACYCRRAGVWITCHQLRHTFGRHMVEARMPVTSLQRLLGHARIRTTQVYMHISDRQVQADYEAAMEQIGRRFAASGDPLPEGNGR